MKQSGFTTDINNAFFNHGFFACRNNGQVVRPENKTVNIVFHVKFKDNKEWSGLNENQVLFPFETIDNIEEIKFSPDFISEMGAISQATLREIDLYNNLTGFLCTFPLLKQWFSLSGKEIEDKVFSYGELDEIAYDVYEELFPALDSLAPEDYYFGAHPGDGACFGYWECEKDEGE